MAEQLNFYDIIKNTKGTLSLTLPSYDMTAPERVITIPFNAKQIRVPRTFALGIFVDPVLESMYKKGKFRVEPADKFEAEVAEIFYPIEDKVKVYAEAEIVKMLQQGNRVGIRQLLEESGANRDNVIIIAREHIGDIPMSMIQDLEKMLGVELQVENASME